MYIRAKQAVRLVSFQSFNLLASFSLLCFVGLERAVQLSASACLVFNVFSSFECLCERRSAWKEWTPEAIKGQNKRC